MSARSPLSNVGRESSLARLVGAVSVGLVALFAITGVGFVLFTSLEERFAQQVEESQRENRGVIDGLAALDAVGAAAQTAAREPTFARLDRLASARFELSRRLQVPASYDDAAERRPARRARAAWRRANELLAAATVSQRPAQALRSARTRRELTRVRDALVEAARMGRLELGKERERTRDQERQVSMLLVAQVLVGLLVTAGVIWWLVRRLLTPLRLLGQGAERLRRGDLSHRLRLARPTPELAAVAHTFNSMAASLEGSRAKLEHDALHDGLTGLGNRRLLARKVAAALADGREPGRTSLLYVDLDGFKLVNDSLGHTLGDLVLVEVAERLGGAVRATDTVARVGGDEFAVLVTDGKPDDPGVAVGLAQRIIHAFERPFAAGDRTVALSASVGIATATSEHDIGALLRDADVAMYSAKQVGPGRYELFSADLHLAAVRRLELIADLRRSIENEELRLVYQPLVDMRTEAVVGAEALVRWDHPERGPIPPAEFVPLAEETGLIFDLGRWVLRTSLAQARWWDTRHPGSPPLRVSVNLSARRVLDPHLVRDIRAALYAEQLRPERLVLEITETAFMRDGEGCVRKLTELRALGVQVALDDFGTGYSSLAYLSRLPITELKIARPFVAGLGKGGPEAALVRATLELAHGLGLGVVGEGVEEREQHEVLRAMGCDLAQGFLYHRPMEPDALDRLLDSPAGTSRAGGRSVSFT